jgi:hypothetical protein
MKNKKIKTTLILSIVILMNVSVASAWIRYGPNGEWPSNIVTSLYYYNFSSYSVTGGANAWNSEVEIARLYAHPTPGSCYVFLYDTSDKGYIAMTDHYPSNTQEYIEVSIYYDTDDMDVIGSLNRTRVITHEFGHCYGLKHEIWPEDAIMLEFLDDLERKSISTPQDDDVDGIDYIY